MLNNEQRSSILKVKTVLEFTVLVKESGAIFLHFKKIHVVCSHIIVNRQKRHYIDHLLWTGIFLYTFLHIMKSLTEDRTLFHLTDIKTKNYLRFTKKCHRASNNKIHTNWTINMS